MQRLAAFVVLSSFVVVTSGQSTDIRCYACTTIDANAMLNEISDPNWLRWLENVRYVPFSQHCADYFQVDLALRDGVKSTECPNGVCMKMMFQEKNGNLEVCTCDGNLCNVSAKLAVLLNVLVAAVMLL